MGVFVGKIVCPPTPTVGVCDGLVAPQNSVRTEKVALVSRRRQMGRPSTRRLTLGKLVPEGETSLGVVVPIGIMVRHREGTCRVSGTGLMDLIHVRASLFPNPSMFLGQEGVRENDIDIMVGQAIRLE
jgi:hypothetical protein